MYPRISTQQEDRTCVTSSLYYNYRKTGELKSRSNVNKADWRNAAEAINFTMQTRKHLRKLRAGGALEIIKRHYHPIPSAITLVGPLRLRGNAFVCISRSGRSACVCESSIAVSSLSALDASFRRVVFVNGQTIPILSHTRASSSRPRNAAPRAESPLSRKIRTFLKYHLNRPHSPPSRKLLRLPQPHTLCG